MTNILEEFTCISLKWMLMAIKSLQYLDSTEQIRSKTNTSILMSIFTNTSQMTSCVAI